MSDEHEKILDSGLRHLLASMEVNGVGAVKVQDGELFAFTRSKLQELIDQMDQGGDKHCIVFVKTGPIAGSTPEN